MEWVSGVQWKPAAPPVPVLDLRQAATSPDAFRQVLAGVLAVSARPEPVVELPRRPVPVPGRLRVPVRSYGTGVR
ncbi:MAG: hypothetical protein IT303_01570 [Dehalococcoidia bacterium]|nr:hypothetical protein [Dehalococcoidia bacterium]